MLHYIRATLAHSRPLTELVLPLALFIDTYYRTEWFYLHTSWGHELLGVFFGGH